MCFKYPFPAPAYRPDVRVLPSLALTRKTATAHNTQTRLAAFRIWGIIAPRALRFHLCSCDSYRNKSARKAGRPGSVTRPPSDIKFSTSTRASGTCEKVSKVDTVVGRDALSAGCNPTGFTGTNFQ